MGRKWGTRGAEVGTPRQFRFRPRNGGALPDFVLRGLGP